jgi:hypothetical protein
MDQIRLLMLSGASLVGQNVLATVSNTRVAFRLSAINSVATEPSLFDFDEVYLSGNLRDDPEKFEQRFMEVLAAVDPHLVVPCRDDDVAFLARLGESLPGTSARFLCGAYNLAEAMLDKQSSWAFSREHGLPYAPTISTEAATPSLAGFGDEHGFPLLAKPRQGFASHGVFLVLDQAQLDRVMGRPGYVLQKYVGDAAPVLSYARSVAAEGVPLFHTFEAIKLSIQAFIAPNGRTAGVFATRNTMRQGRSERVVKDDDPELETLGAQCAKVFSEQGWRGPLNIQCQRTPTGELMIYEYNGRFTGATAARYLMGYDEVRIALGTFCGLRLDSPQSAAGTPPAEVIRLQCSRSADPAQVMHLMQTGYWCRA